MNKKALILSVCALICSVQTMPVKAASNTDTSVSESNQERTSGLISQYYITVTESSGKLCINGTTESNLTMKSIGYKDIFIEYSSDNVNWKREKSLDDMLKSGSSYYLNNYSVSVKGGRYYRVSLTHYAKESSWFGSSQSVNNTSNSVWIN